jgi:hypothetical protein
MDIAKAFVSGIVVIGLVSAVGMHAGGLAKVTKAGGSAGQGLLRTSMTGKK